MEAFILTVYGCVYFLVNTMNLHFIIFIKWKLQLSIKCSWEVCIEALLSANAASFHLKEDKFPVPVTQSLWLFFNTAHLLLKMFLYRWNSLVKCILWIKDMMFCVCIFISDLCKYIADFTLSICQRSFFLYGFLIWSYQLKVWNKCVCIELWSTLFFFCLADVTY